MPTFTNSRARLLARAQRSRSLSAVLLFAGVYLLALPLVFTVFAHETGQGHHFSRRVALAAVWFLCALLVGAVATTRELAELTQRARDAVPRKRRAADRRELAALASIAALLRPGATGLSDSFRFAAFIPNRDGILVPVLEPDPQPWQRWPAGSGVVGEAWAHREAFVEVAGEETTAPERMLTPEQLQRYGDLTYVAAHAIFDEAGQAVGVLSVACHDGSDFAEAGGPERFQLLVSDMGVLVGDARVGRGE
jgi:hypothetical protein